MHIYKSFSPFLPLYLTVPSDLGWLYAFLSWASGLGFICSICASYSVKLKQLEEAGWTRTTQLSPPTPTRSSSAVSVLALDVSFSKFSVYSLQLLQPSVRLPKYIYQAPPRRLNAFLRFCASSSLCFVVVVPGRRPETGDGGGAGGAVPRRRVVVRGRLALPSPRPSVSPEPCELWLLVGCVAVFRGDACTDVLRS